MGILSGRTIDAAVQAGLIKIDPYEPKHLNPASIDLTLGDRGVMYLANPHTQEVKLDARVEAPAMMFGFDVLELMPGKLYLLHTAERVRTDCYVPILEGKSSIGRLGICVHLTAGYGDPGFDGQYTLEVTSVYPTRIYAGMKFCQMRFERFDDSGEAMSKPGHRVLGHGPVRYEGNYTGEAAMGPVPSRSWKQFK
jgi:dCTP deaminase